MKTNQRTSPKWQKRLLGYFIPEQLLEEFTGDLEEMYQDRIAGKSVWYAKLMYWIECMHLIINFSSIPIFKRRNNTIMLLQNMSKIAFRNAIRKKQYTFLNVFGLMLGISTSMFIGMYVHNEMSYDDFHDKGERIYRVNQPSIWGDWNEPMADTGPNVAVAMREDIPEFEEVTRLLTMGSEIVRKGGKESNTSFKETKCFMAEDNFFDVFSFEFLAGDATTALDDAMSIILTKSASEKYFGYKDALGETLEIKYYDGTWRQFKVTGVLEDIPSNSHLQFDMLVSLKSVSGWMENHGWKWIATAFSTYGLVYPDVDPGIVESKLQLLPPKWAPPTTEKIFNQSFDDFTKGQGWSLYLQPLNEIYLSDAPDGHRFGPSGNYQAIIIFSAIGILVLLLSCINFMNLSTAKSVNRSKEVGIRKVLGSQRSTIVSQFIFESLIFVAFSTALALVFVYFGLGLFNNLAQMKLDLGTYLKDPLFLVVLMVFMLALGFLSGSYPAFYLSSFKPVESLKKTSSGANGKSLRNGLIVFQFTISVTLMICTYFVQRQINFTSNLDIGYEKGNVVQLHNIEQFGFDTETVKQVLESNPAFSSVGKSFGVPPEIFSGDRYMAKDTNAEVVQLNNLRTGPDYLNVLGLKFIAGRNFDDQNVTDKYKVILNEQAVRAFGWGSREDFNENSPIGKIVKVASGSEDELEVIGVVEDFNFHSVKSQIQPLVLLHHLNEKTWDYGAGQSFYSMRFDPKVVTSSEDISTILNATKKDLAKIDPSYPFEYSFLDQNFEDTFRSEKRMGNILNVFTAMALIIACLGLFGLAAFSAEQKRKEIGIRKVIGANVSQLVVLFSGEFTRLVVIAILIAFPISYFLVLQWLSEFAYKTNISLFVFAGVAIAAIIISLATVGYQSISAAYKNPVDSLKDE